MVIAVSFGGLLVAVNQPQRLDHAGTPPAGSPTKRDCMNKITPHEIIKSQVWTDSDASEAIVVHEGARIAAHFNLEGMVVIVQEDVLGDDQAIVFDHRYINIIIQKLEDIAALSPEDFVNDDFLEAVNLFSDNLSTDGE